MPTSRVSAQEFEEHLRTALPFSRVYFPEVLALEHGEARLRAPYRPEFIRPGGTLNGPLLMALADLAMYAAVLTVVGMQPLAVTSQLSINFLRKPAQAAVLATGRTLKVGRRLAVGQVELFSEGDPQLIAHAVCTYALPGPGA